MRALLFALALTLAPPAQAQDNPLAALDFLHGCWSGPFAGQANVTDEHCFAPMLGGRYLRDTHVVRGGAPYSGESIYWYDAEAHRIAFAYFASDGGTSRGYAEAAAEGVAFPADRYVGADGQVLNLREHWVRHGDDALEVIVEIEHGGGWREFMRATWRRAPEASPASQAH